MSQAVLKERVANVTGTGEDDRAGEPDLETVHVKTVDGELESQ